MLIARAAGTVTGGRLADRFGRLPVIRGSFAVTAAGLGAIVVAGLPWVFGAIALTGFALNQSFSLTVTLGQDYLPTGIGTSSGVTLGLAISVGGCTWPSLCWPRSRSPGWRWPAAAPATFPPGGGLAAGRTTLQFRTKPLTWSQCTSSAAANRGR